MEQPQDEPRRNTGHPDQDGVLRGLHYSGGRARAVQSAPRHPGS